MHDLRPKEEGLTIERHQGELQALAEDWTRLEDPDHPGAPFRSWAWLSAWWRSAPHSGVPWILVARRQGSVRGILPMYLAPAQLGAGTLRLMGDGIVGSDYLGIIGRAEDARENAEAFARHLSAIPFDIACLDGLVSEDPLLAAAAGATVTPRYQCPLIRLSGSFDDYLASLDEVAQQWHRRVKWLSQRPNFRFEVLRTPAEFAQGMHVLFDLHRQRWALEGGSDAIDGPRLEAFHRLAAAALADRGWARLFLLHVDGAPRAALYGFVHGKSFSFYQAGHDPAWRQRSVGTVLLGLVVQYCLDLGLSEFDFLRGTEPYKLQWSNGMRQTFIAEIVGHGLRAHLLRRGAHTWKALRQQTKRLLPASTVTWMQLLRKRLAHTGES